MHFQIYLPGKRGANPAFLDEVELSSFKDGAEFDWIDSGGPDGKNGMLVSWRKGDPQIDAPRGISPEVDWVQSPGDEPYWIGINREDPPTPSQLARPKQLRGNLVRLADGNSWNVPSAYYIPAKNGIDWKTGKFKRSVEPQFEEYCARAGRYAAQFFEREEEIALLAKAFDLNPEHAGKIEIPLEESWDHSVDALSLNYRVNAEIITLLGLLDDSSIVAVCAASFDLPLIEQAVKKNELPSQIGIPGGSTL